MGTDPLDLLLGLNSDVVARLRPRSGQMEALSLTVSFDFTADAWANAPEGSRERRTVLHETTHAYQALATSYGQYYAMLRSFQISRAQQVLVQLRELGAPLRPPLIRQVLASGSSPRWRQARLEMYGWFLAEIVAMLFEGDAVGFGHQLEHNGFVSGRPMTQLFSELESYLVPWLQARGHRVAGSARRLREDVRQERLQVFWKLMIGQGDVVSVLEAGARVNEYWATWPAGMESFRPMLLRGTRTYTLWPGMALHSLRTTDPKVFSLSFAALVDLALNPPLLPHHAALRGQDDGMLSLNPSVRIMNGLFAVGAAGMPLIHDLQRDYVPFIDAVCAETGWPRPWEMTSTVLSSLPPPAMADPLTRLYGRSQAVRRSTPTAFLDLDVWNSDEQEAEAFRRDFVHPVIQFADRTFVHPDKILSGVAVLTYCMHEYLRQLMVVGNRPIRLPMAAGPADIAAYTELLDQALAEQVGIAASKIQLVSGP